MLIITRKPGEKIMLGDDVVVHVMEIVGNSVRVGIQAPRSLPVYREEIWDAVRAENRAAAQAAFSKLLSNQSLSPPQIRFVEMIIEQLTARGVIEPGALYEAPFTGLHAGGPDALFAGKSELIAGIFAAIEATQPAVASRAG